MRLNDTNLHKKLRDFHSDGDPDEVSEATARGHDPFPKLSDSKITPLFLSVEGVQRMTFSVGSYKKINNSWYMLFPHGGRSFHHFQCAVKYLCK